MGVASIQKNENPISFFYNAFNPKKGEKKGVYMKKVNRKQLNIQVKKKLHAPFIYAYGVEAVSYTHLDSIYT